MKLTTCNRLAAPLLAIFAACTLHAQTYFLQSLGGQGSVPYPMDPYHGTMPMTEVSDDTYVIEDGDSESLDSGGMMTMDSIDPTDPGNTNSAPLPTPPPDIRNYAKYGAQFAALLDTNSLANDGDTGDSNLAYSCGAINGPTNGLPWLTIKSYGADGIIIRADNFDYSQTNAQLALLVCDKVNTPIWKVVDFNGASDAQDGWLVQTFVTQPNVASTMFFQVTNLNMSYDAFFTVIPYNGPQVAIIGTNQPFDVVSNVITLTTQIYDLSGTTNEHFLVDVNGDSISTRSSLSNNAITLDTKYNPNGQDYGIDNVDLSVGGFPTVYGNSPNTNVADIQTSVASSASIPLDFENVNYLLDQSFLAQRDIGTNSMLWVCLKEEDVTCTISDPSSNVVASYGGHITGPSIVEIDWNFTEADGMTPYSNTTYTVHFVASDPDDFLFSNQIANNDEIRRAAGCFVTYENENPGDPLGAQLDAGQTTWLDETLVYLYQSLYDNFGITQYTPSQIGANRNFSASQGLTASNTRWANFMPQALSNAYTSFVDGLDYAKYSDLTIGGAHGTGQTIGGGPGHIIKYLSDTFTPAQIQGWLQAPDFAPQWRLRKVAIWSCDTQNAGVYSEKQPGPQGQTSGQELDFISACGIRDIVIQTHNRVYKNTAWATTGLLNEGLVQSDGTTVDTSAKVAFTGDDLWVTGQDTGIADPTYTSFWVVQQLCGFYPALAPSYGGGPHLDAYGYPYLPYTSIYDGQLELYHNLALPPFVHNR
jgi:hypothetical protein